RQLDALGFHQARGGVGRLGALLEPVRGAVGVDAQGVFGGLARIVVPDLLDVVAAALDAAVDHDEAVVRVLHRAHAHQADLDHNERSSVALRRYRAGTVAARPSTSQSAPVYTPDGAQTNERAADARAHARANPGTPGRRQRACANRRGDAAAAPGLSDRARAACRGPADACPCASSSCA